MRNTAQSRRDKQRQKNAVKNPEKSKKNSLQNDRIHAILIGLKNTRRIFGNGALWVKSQEFSRKNHVAAE